MAACRSICCWSAPTGPSPSAAKSHDEEYELTQDDVDAFRVRRKAILELLKVKRRPEHFMLLYRPHQAPCYFNEINPLVVELSNEP